ncbi:MAG: hypothetical protein AAFW81_09450 [Pseudomonadota bacterium]
MPPNNRELVDREREALLTEIRANVAFEHLIVAILAGAAASGAAFLIAKMAARLVAGASAAGALWAGLAGALVMASLFFVVGFGAGAAIITPLHKSLESAKRRQPWPYIAVAAGVAVLAFVAARLLPGFSAPGALAGLGVFVGLVVLGAVFARRMRPVWLAAAKAEEAEAVREAPFRIM